VDAIEFRKLIKFGNSSHVVSLPRNWLSRNKLDKGDVVYLQENGGNELILTPAEPKLDKEDREIVLDISKKTVEALRRELTSAYIKDFNLIKIVDKNLKDRAMDIRNELRKLMALEIVDQTQTSITARVLLNLQDVNVNVMIRRMDTIIRTMMADLKDAIRDDVDHFENLRHRDQDVNRIFYVIMRLANHGIDDPSFASAIKLTPKDLFNYWGVGMYLESIADEVKRISEVLKNTRIKKRTRQFLLDLFMEVESGYLEVMKAYHTKDIQLAFSYSERRKRVFERCDKLYSEMNRGSEVNLKVLAINERFKNMVEGINRISRRVYD